jgi:hypothetical protein
LLLLVIAWTVPVSVQAAPPGQQEYSESQDMNKYLALGAVVLVGGLIIWDILEDRGSEASEEEAALVDSSRIESTGVDWDHLDPSLEGPSTVVVSILPVTDGELLSRLIIAEMAANLDGQSFSVSSEPIHLGGISSPGEAFEMAESYFDADVYLHSTSLPDGGVSVTLLLGTEYRLLSDTLIRVDSTSVSAAARRMSEALGR